MDRILLSLAHMGGTEINYVNKAFETNWIVPLGPNVDDFEKRLSAFMHTEKPVVALSSGTAAIHMGLIMAGVKPGDEVVCQSLTFSASANPILYQGAKPVFVDSEDTTWNIDPDLLEEALEDRKKVTGKYPRAVIPVHLYGMPAQMDKIKEICDKRDILIVEDAAEALGSTFDGKFCGTLGRYGALSFNGNKIITTSGGGALVCPSAEDAARVKFLSTQAREPLPYYYHKTIGYNYRLSNVSAGIGCGQMEVIEDHLARRRYNHERYADAFADVAGIKVHTNPSAKYNSNYWLTTILIDPSIVGKTPDEVRLALEEENIESRLIWRPMHMQPVFEKAPFYGTNIGQKIFETGLCLPSSSCLSDQDLDRVISAIIKIVKK